MGKFANYELYCQEQAKLLFNDDRSDFMDYLKEGSIRFYDFFDDSVHNWADNDFIYVDLLDSAEILDQSNNVETDSGLWQGEEPRKAIATQAFFTYRGDLFNALKDEVYGYLEELESEAISDLGFAQEELDSKTESLDEDADVTEETSIEREKLDKVEAYLSYIQDTMNDIF